MLGHKRGGLRNACGEAIAQHRVQTRYLFRRQKTRGLIGNSLIALPDFLQITLRILRRACECLIEVAGNSVRQLERLGFYELEELGGLLLVETVAAELAVQ